MKKQDLLVNEQNSIIEELKGFKQQFIDLNN